MFVEDLYFKYLRKTQHGGIGLHMSIMLGQSRKDYLYATTAIIRHVFGQIPTPVSVSYHTESWAKEVSVA